MREKLKPIAAVLILAVVAVPLGLYLVVRASLPILDGDIELQGLSAPVTVLRDGLGVPTIRGENRNDVARVTGFIHAQDRFFQMDLMRRSAAGELSALVGRGAARVDRDRRRHRFRAMTSEVMARTSSGERALLEAYADGVNAGLAALTLLPFEYLLLRADPEPWRPEDTVLGNIAMFFELTDDDASRESGYAEVYDGLPEDIRRFLFAGGTEWDAPMLGDAWSVPEIPDAGTCELVADSARADGTPLQDSMITINMDEPIAGSNAWAVAARNSATGRAIVANDMHLGLNIPNIWYRMRLIVGDPDADGLDLSGVTLPGTPFLVAGSNSSVAWGFTNSRGDWSDLVVLELDPEDDGAYLTPEGYLPFEEYDELIEVKDGDAELFRVRWSIWGPVVGENHNGQLLALHWLAHEPEAVNLKIVELEAARNVAEALELAPSIGIPPQNIMVADGQGTVGWTIMGRVPLRVGYDSTLPASWADGATGWQGWLPATEYPRVIDPDSGFVWTANARVIDGEVLGHLGYGGYALGARASQIRDGLLALGKADMDDMLAIQLDDRAVLHYRWRDLLLAALTDGATAGNPERTELRRQLEQWDGRASVESVAYRMTREFRRRVHAELLTHVLRDCGGFGRPIELSGTNQAEGPVWRLVEERPARFLPTRHDTWDSMFLTIADDSMGTCGRYPVSECTWGRINDVEIEHPLVDGLDILEYWLMGHDGPLPGGDHTPRVQQREHGASERFAVSPGDEENGYFHMPGGQSGHPLSPYFLAGHDAWVRGEPLPFLPGPPEHTLTFH